MQNERVNTVIVRWAKTAMVYETPDKIDYHRDLTDLEAGEILCIYATNPAVEAATVTKIY